MRIIEELVDKAAEHLARLPSGWTLEQAVGVGKQTMPRAFAEYERFCVHVHKTLRPDTIPDEIYLTPRQVQEAQQRLLVHAARELQAKHGGSLAQNLSRASANRAHAAGMFATKGRE